MPTPLIVLLLISNCNLSPLTSTKKIGLGMPLVVALREAPRRLTEAKFVAFGIEYERFIYVHKKSRKLMLRVRCSGKYSISPRDKRSGWEKAKFACEKASIISKSPNTF